MRARFLLAVAVPAAAFASLATTVNRSEGVTPADDVERAECATRVSLALTGRAPSAELVSAPDPQAQIDTLLASPEFVEQFARFINSQMNPEPGETPAADATYWMVRHVLTNNRPWREVFDGKYRVEAVAATATDPATARVVDDAAGLGYFRSRPWMIRYAGNEEQGYRLNSAFRIQQNVIGLEVTAVTNVPGTDISATGRQAAACRSCHYDSYFALDKVAKVLSTVSGPMNNPVFTAPTEGPQQLLDGRTIANDEELVKALVESTQHKFHTCRLAFQYLYGRPEAQCENALFDRCVDEYTNTGDIRAALRVIAADQSFCE
jgi:hypothetical protein